MTAEVPATTAPDGSWLSGRARPLLALAPMQDVTDLPFWRLMTRYGGADVYFTEYFRVHPDSRLEKPILQSIDRNPTGRPVVAQMIGNDIPSLVRSARELQRHAVAAIDLNLGCPAPVVYRKCAGGGLLRDLPRVDAILAALRQAVTVPLTVKTRIGFDGEAHFDALLEILARHSPDLVTVHGRTVTGMYRTEVRYDLIARAAESLPCPVLANGNISSPPFAARVLETTGVHGLMLGRGAIRNPWLFTQIRTYLRTGGYPQPAGTEVLAYVHDLWETVYTPGAPEAAQVHRMKKYMNFLGAGVDPAGEFLHAIRRVATREAFFAVCTAFLDHPHPMPLEPFPALTPQAPAPG